MKIVFASYAVAVALPLAACALLSSPEAKNVERDVLRVADVACILANSMLDAPAIAEACSIEHKLEPAILDVLAAHKAAAKREHVGGCLDKSDPWTPGKDAGGDSAADAGRDAK